jgi:hypothetical protein
VAGASQSTRKIGLALGAILFFVSAMYWVSRGDRACDRAAKLLREAKSFQVDIGMGDRGHRTISVHCPDRFRIVSIVPGAGKLEMVVIGGSQFGRVDRSRWMRVPSSFVNLPKVPLCADGKPGEKDVATLLDELGDGTRMESQGSRSVNGRECQGWRAVPRGPRFDPDKGPHVDVCIDNDSGHILEMVAEDTTWTFTHWNSADPVEAPTLDPIAQAK